MNPVEEIKSKLDIVDVISSHINLTKAGANYKVQCPFHNEKTASFMVSQEKQIWHCFGCDRGGDLFSFVQEYEGITFAEALRILAERANVPLEGYQTQKKADYSNLYEINRLAVEFYQSKLKEDKEVAQKVREYLKKRKVDEDSIAKWQLGLSGEDWDELYNYLISKGFKDEQIFQAGLSLKKKSGSGYIDRFRKRLMFPIADVQGRVVGFTSRMLIGIAYDEEEQGGKYINSPQTVIYDKSRILYGWHLAKQAVRQKKYLIIVEGNMDAILASTQTDNVVAVSGTALTTEHIKIIKRYTNNMILAFDGDAAGSRAALRSVILGWEAGMNLKILLLPKGKDPADIITADPQNWTKAVKESMPVMDYYFKRIIAGVDLTRSDHKKIAVQRLLPMIKHLESKVEQAHYLKKLSDKLDIPENVLNELMAGIESFVKSPTVQQTVAQTKAKKDSLLLLSEKLLSIALYKTSYLDKMLRDIEVEMIEASLQPLYRTVLIYYTKHQNLDNFKDYSELNDQAKADWIRLSLLAEKDYSEYSAKELDKDWQNLMARLKNQYLDKERQQLINQLKQAELEENTEEQDKLVHKINILNKEINKLYS